VPLTPSAQDARRTALRDAERLAQEIGGGALLGGYARETTITAGPIFGEPTTAEIEAALGPRFPYPRAVYYLHCGNAELWYDQR